MAIGEHNLIAMERLERAAAVMRVLAHPHRLRMCELLLGERYTVNELADHLGIAPNAASQHLNIMKAHSILVSQREGKVVYYRVADPRPGWLLSCIRGQE